MNIKTLFGYILGKRKENKYIEALKKRGLKIGQNTDIVNANIDWGYCYLIEIGNNTTITNASILAHDASTKKRLGYTKIGKVKIGNNCFVGMGSIILPGVTIGNDVIIGAGSVVREDIPDNSVVAGNPAKKVCDTETYFEKNIARLKVAPKWDTVWKDKSADEIKEMQYCLENTMGYDI